MAKLIVIGGPTATGKTRLGVALAHRLNGEVVSADSMQVYRDMAIGTARPTPEEMEGIPHHMLAVADPKESYSVARYVQQATACVEDILRRGKQPILVGGTGLYIDALCRGRTFSDHQPETGTRTRLQDRVTREGLPILWRELEQVDPESAARLHPNDQKRILRALEVWYDTGKTISQHNRETQALPPRYQTATLLLTYRDRQDLYARIDQRVDQMMARGLAGEVRALLAAGVPRSSTAMQAIGYKEFFPYFEGTAPLDACTEKLKQASRNYAKRQLTWFRHMDGVVWLDASAPDVTARAVQLTQEFLAKG